VNTLVDTNFPATIKLDALRQASNADKTLNLVKRMIKGEKVVDECIEPFVGIQHELSISEDGLVLRGSKIPSVVQ
jgi:hypothetical protein